MSAESGSGPRASARLSRPAVVATALATAVAVTSVLLVLATRSAEPSTAASVPPAPPTSSGPSAVDPSTSGPAPSPSDTHPAAPVNGPRTIMGADWERSGPAHDSRDVDEVLTLIVPLGCVQRSPLPRPTHVVEDTYAHQASSVPAVLIRLDFDSAKAAQGFLKLRLADLSACAGQPKDPYSGAPAPVTSLVRTAAGITATERTDPFAPTKTATWTELFVADGTRVYGLAVNVGATRASTVGLNGLQTRLAAVAQLGSS